MLTSSGLTVVLLRLRSREEQRGEGVGYAREPVEDVLPQVQQTRWSASPRNAYPDPARQSSPPSYVNSRQHAVIHPRRRILPNDQPVVARCCWRWRPRPIQGQHYTPGSSQTARCSPLTPLGSPFHSPAVVPLAILLDRKTRTGSCPGSPGRCRSIVVVERAHQILGVDRARRRTRTRHQQCA